MTDKLKAHLRKALAGSTAQRPVDTNVLAEGHHRRRVEATLMEMYQARKINCCKITNEDGERVVWWLVENAMPVPITHCSLPPKNGAARTPAKHVRRISQLSQDVIALVKRKPGLLVSEVYAEFPAKDEMKVTSAVCNLAKTGHFLRKGQPRKYRYYPNEVAQ